jgi:restriction system protein
MSNVWKVTAGRGNGFVAQFLSCNVVAIGWLEGGNVVAIRSRAELTDHFRASFPDQTQRQVEVGANQVWRFHHEIEIGDEVVTYDPKTRLYHLGTVEGPARFDPAVIERLPTVRSVRWRATRPRDALSQTTKNSLGAILTLFRIPDRAAAELRTETPTPAEPNVSDQSQTPADWEAAVDPYDSIVEQALERTKDRISRLEWDEMQELIAALLRALGYRTIVSPVGPDRGKDIVASRDGFGFERPRIVVEVKHRRGAMGAQEIRSFLGGRHVDDRGLYVSTGGFTREAHYEAERASTVTHLMTLDDLARAVIEQYDSMDERGRRLLPMTRLYWPS